MDARWRKWFEISMEINWHVINGPVVSTDKEKIILTFVNTVRKTIIVRVDTVLVGERNQGQFQVQGEQVGGRTVTKRDVKSMGDSWYRQARYKAFKIQALKYLG